MKISEEKKRKISGQIISYLYEFYPKSFFTVEIAREIIRDEEFVKKLLLNLKKNNLVLEIKKNPLGKTYLRRSRWKLSDSAYDVYKNS